MFVMADELIKTAVIWSGWGSAVPEPNYHIIP